MTITTTITPHRQRQSTTTTINISNDPSDACGVCLMAFFCSEDLISVIFGRVETRRKG